MSNMVKEKAMFTFQSNAPSITDRVSFPSEWLRQELRKTTQFYWKVLCDGRYSRRRIPVLRGEMRKLKNELKRRRIREDDRQCKLHIKTHGNVLPFKESQHER